MWCQQVAAFLQVFVAGRMQTCPSQALILYNQKRLYPHQTGYCIHWAVFVSLIMFAKITCSRNAGAMERAWINGSAHAQFAHKVTHIHFLVPPETFLPEPLQSKHLTKLVSFYFAYPDLLIL